MGSVGSNGSTETQETGLTNPASLTFQIVNEDTEYARTFPDNTKAFRILNGGPYLLKVSYQENESGLNYMPIFPGDDLKWTGIIAQSFTVYMQAEGAVKAHIESWT